MQVLTRALRVHELKDMFSGTRHILQTITKDPKTERVRSIKPGEEVESMWDALDHTAKSFSFCPDDENDQEMEEDFAASYTYTEADELEDAILFPQEADGQMTDNLFRYDKSAMEVFETEMIDIRRFAADLDTDEEPSDSDFDSEFDDEELDEEELAALEEDDGDPDWASDESASMVGDDDDDDDEFVLESENVDMDEALDTLIEQFQSAGSREPDYFLPILRAPENAHGLPESVTSRPANLMHTLRMALRSQKLYDTSHASMEADFYRHIDRHKSKGTMAFGVKTVSALRFII